MKYQAVLDAKGRRVPNLVRYRGGEISVRKQFRKLGIPDLFESTGETTLGRARAAAEVIIQRHKNRHLGIDDSHVFGRRRTKTVAMVAEWILEHHTPKQRPGTQKLHHIYLGENSLIVREWGHWDVSNVTTEGFAQWVTHLRKTGKRKTFFDVAKSMGLLMRVAYDQKLVTHFLKFKNPDPKTNTSWRVYTPEEITALFKVMGEELRDQFVLSYECMMRLREVLKLEWDRVNLETGVITLRAQDVKTGTKTGQGREFVMSAHARDRLTARRARRDWTSPFVFPSRTGNGPVHENKSAWKAAKKDAGITGKATWHSLRHTAITQALMEQRMSPTAVSEYCGTSVGTLQRVYLHSRADHTKDVAAAISILNPVVRKW